MGMVVSVAENKIGCRRIWVLNSGWANECSRVTIEVRVKDLAVAIQVFHSLRLPRDQALLFMFNKTQIQCRAHQLCEAFQMEVAVGDSIKVKRKEVVYWNAEFLCQVCPTYKLTRVSM